MKTTPAKILVTAALLAACAAHTQQLKADAYDAPANYYASANGLTGSALKSQLTTIVSTNFHAINYGDARYALQTTDKDPNGSQLLAVYSRSLIGPSWDNGVTWNREHLWPVSLSGIARPDNSTKSPLTDLFELRASKSSENGSRGNKAYGEGSSYFYPGDYDKGDVSRALFYMVTRYPTQLSLTPGAISGVTPAGNLSDMLKWHYQDVPDTFERQRNQYIYSNPNNSAYSQGNRNPYVDHPEYVWSVFVDQQNDTRLTTDKTNVNLGRIFVGSSLGSQTVTINKDGMDGTYYSVTTGGNATSSLTGRYNAFEMNKTGSKAITVGLNASTSTAGLKSGTVTVDNLDITTQGGAGRGANDENDIVDVSATVVDHAKASLSGNSALNAITLNFGTLTQGSGSTLSFTLSNLESTADYTAMLDLDNITFTGDNAFSSNLHTLKNLQAGASETFLITLSALTAGDFSGTYYLTTSDEDLAGALTYAPLMINVTGSVAAVPEPATCLLLSLAGAGLLARRRR